MEIRWLRPDAADRDLVEVARRWNLHHAEVGIATPPCTVEEVRARLNHGWDGEPERIGLVTGDGPAAGAVATAFLPNREDTDMAIVGCLAGAGPAATPVLASVLARLLADVVDAGRRHVLAESWDFIPEQGEVLRDLGFAPAHHQVLYERSMASPVDQHLRSDGIALEHHQGLAPDDLLGELGDVADAIADAPTGEVVFDHVRHTVERLRQWELGQLERGQRIHRTVARERRTGQAVGHSVVTVSVANASLALQHDTAVLATHRGTGVGEGLKVAMLAALSRTEPRVTTVQTWNAADNVAIRALNQRMGFAEVASATAWEIRFGPAAEGGDA